MKILNTNSKTVFAILITFVVLILLPLNGYASQGITYYRDQQSPQRFGCRFETWPSTSKPFLFSVELQVCPIATRSTVDINVSKHISVLNGILHWNNQLHVDDWQKIF